MIEVKPSNDMVTERLAQQVYNDLSWRGLGGKLSSVEIIKLVLTAVAAMDEPDDEE